MRGPVPEAEPGPLDNLRAEEMKMTVSENPVYAVGMMVLGLAAGCVWYGFRLKKNGLAGVTALWTALLGSVLALLCAKFAYLLHDLGASIFEDGYYDEITTLTPETLSFIGGAAGFIGGAAIAARIGGIRPMKALDLFAAPGCVFLCLARLAEGGMYDIGIGGSELGIPFLKFFPLAVQRYEDTYYLCVYVLEALAALLCLIPALKGKAGGTDGGRFRRTAVCLLSAQIFFEMMVSYPYIRSFYTSFVSLEQVLCAVLLLALVIAGCIRNGRWLTLPVILVLLGISAFFQFFRDNKIDFLYDFLYGHEWYWAIDCAPEISLGVFFLVSVGLSAAGLKAVSPKRREKTEKM